MILDKGESGVLLDPKIFSMKLDDEESSLTWGKWWWSYETQVRWLVSLFKSGKDSVGEINSGGRCSLGLVLELEEEWVDWWCILIIGIRLKELSFNARKNWENDEEMCSCEFLLSSSVLEFEDVSLNTQDVELHLDFFRRVEFDSIKDWNDDVSIG